MDLNIDYAQVGQRMKRLRFKNQITQAVLAERTDVTPSYVCLVETGKRQPSLDYFIKVADELNTTLDFLLTGTVPPSDKEKINPELLSIFTDCSDSDKNMLVEIMRDTKGVLKKYGRIGPH